MANLCAYILWLVLRSLSIIIKLIPLRVLQPIGALLGDIIQFFGFRRSIIQQNLTLAFEKQKSPEELKEIEKKHYHHLGKWFFESLRNLSLTKKDYEKETSWEGIEKVQTTLSQNKGLAIISIHYGNWESVLTSFSLCATPVTVVVKKMHNPVSQWIVERQRKKFNVDVIYFEGRGGQSVKEILTLWKQNKTVGFVMEQHAPGSLGVICKFFGQPASTAKSLAGLVQRTGVPVIFASGVRQRDGTMKNVVGDPLPYQSSEATDIKQKKEQEIKLNSQMYNDTIENWIKKEPSQWLWIHKRWKATTDRLSSSELKLLSFSK